jgi:site-specific DNA-methyltransferase (adenine-specific)
MKVDIYNTDKKYNIIYADPPWTYTNKGSETGKRGMAAYHYETMKEQDIKELPIQKLCNDKTILFMWATFPNIKQALNVIEAWDFQYKTCGFVWCKKNKKSDSWFWGMGAFTRANAEVCLIATRKGTRAKDIIKNHSVHQIITSKIEEHSKKPQEVRENIIKLCGDLPRIELFARQEVEGWDCWGNEV